ncbi:MAG: Cysteine-rich secretory protein family [Rhodobacteraceae bacterium HLUCCA12]|nr:MAG: Cysteine-rich secretory protein family [Rhodobacteraceae bacterium HLUCCA12]
MMFARSLRGLRAGLIALAVMSLGAASAMACSVPATADDMRAAAVTAINAARRDTGSRALAYSADLQDAAQDHACALARRGRISHRGLFGTGLRTRLWWAGYRAALAVENLAAGQSSANAVVAAWMGSPGHRANLLTPGLRAIGLGLAQDGGGRIYWVMIGAAPR